MAVYDDDVPRSAGAPAWFVTFADLMVLLMCFFVLMLSFSEMDANKFKLLAGSMTEAFGVQTDIDVRDIPKGTSVVANEFSPGIPEPTDVIDVRQHTVDSDLNTLDLGLEQRLKELKDRERAADEQAQRLRDVFRQEIDDGRIMIRRDGTDVVIQILEKDSFGSGRAELDPGSLATLDKIGTLIGSMSGAITVSGHTDDVPIRSGVGRARASAGGRRCRAVDGQRPCGYAAACAERHGREPRLESARRHYVRQRQEPPRRMGGGR